MKRRLKTILVQDRKIVAPRSLEAAKRPYIGLDQIESQTGRISEPQPSDIEVGDSTTFAFDHRHILYGKLRPYLNKVALPEFSGRCTTELIPFLPSESVDRSFAAWILRSPDVLARACSQNNGSRMPRADLDHLLDFEISLPDLPTQRRIAARLKEQMAGVETARKAVEAQQQAVSALTLACLREAFVFRCQSWPTKLLGEICEIQLGKMLSAQSRTGRDTAVYLRNQNVQWGRFDLRSIASMDFSPRERAKFKLLPGDLMVCEGGEPGRAAIWNGEIQDCFYQKALFRLRPLNDCADNHYLLYRLQFGALSGEFSGSNAKSTIAHLPAVRLSKLAIPLPDIQTQRQISGSIREQMAGIDAMQRVLREQITAISALPAAYLREAFGGLS